MKKILATLIVLIGASLAFTAQAQTAQPGRAGWQTDTHSNCKIWNPIPQVGETVEWFGECKNGYAEGGGLLTWKFNSGNEAWNVNMASGKPGSGPYRIVTTHNGTVSTWTGTFDNGIKTGRNVRKFTNGSEFEGTWVNGQINGIGVYKTIDGKRQSVHVANGCIWSAESGGTFINSVDKSENQCLVERSTQNSNTNNVEGQIWNHNGSTMSVSISNDQIKIYYAQPRKVMLDAGAKPNDLLFEGTINGNIIVGTAKIFAHHCGQFAYQVAGSINANKSEINLNGQAPVVDRSTCKQTRLVPDALAFNILPNNANTDTSANPSGQRQTPQNQNENYGDRIRACVQPNVSFPTPPRKDNQNPTAHYRVKLNPNGTINTVDLTKSSGNINFDAAVQKGIFACQQFPKPAQRDYPAYIDIAYNMYDALGSTNTQTTATATVRSAADMKQGFTYKFFRNGSCRPDAKSICLTADEYKKICSIAKSVTQFSIKLRAIGASQTEKVLLEGGNYEQIKVLWSVSGGGSEHCYAVVTASGIVNGNSARADIEGIVNEFIKAENGAILVSSFHLF